MWALLMIILIVSNVNELHASQAGSESEDSDYKFSNQGPNSDIPSAIAFSVKEDNNPTATSFTDELQYPGIRGNIDLSSNGVKNIQPTLKMVSVFFAYFLMNYNYDTKCLSGF